MTHYTSSRYLVKRQLYFLVGRCRHLKLDLIVLVGPNAIQLLAEPKAIFPNVPVIFCCTVRGMLDQIADNRATGLWFQVERAKTVEAGAGFGTGNPPPLGRL